MISEPHGHGQGLLAAAAAAAQAAIQQKCGQYIHILGAYIVKLILIPHNAVNVFFQLLPERSGKITHFRRIPHIFVIHPVGNLLCSKGWHSSLLDSLLECIECHSQKFPFAVFHVVPLWLSFAYCNKSNAKIVQKTLFLFYSTIKIYNNM